MKPRSLSVFRLSLPLATAVAALLGPNHAYGLTYSWSDLVNGTAVSANWSTGTNWSVVPVSAADTTLSFGMTFGSNSTAETNTLTNDVANPFLLNVLTFGGSNPSAANGSNVATVNIAGSPLSLVLNGATTPVVNLNSNRSNGQGVVYNVQSNVALAAGSLITGNGTATFNFSGQLSGSAFTKSGSSALTLSGANNYSGDSTLSAGTLVLANNSALSSGALNVTGDSRIGIASGVNISNAINRGTSTVTYFYSGTSAGTATYSGALTGSGTINLGGSGSGNNTTTLLFTNASGFTGNVVGPSGNINGADYFGFTSIGDGGNFTFQKAGNRGGVTYSGTSAITFGTRQIAIGTGFGGGGTYGVNGNGIPQNAFQNNATNAAHTVTFNSNMSVGTIASSSVFYFDGSNTGDNTFAGTIGDASSTNTLGIGKWGAGKWILTGSNSYEGNTFITNGTLSVNAIDVAANNQPLGKGSIIAFGYNATAGTLEFTGSTNSSTDKQIWLGNTNNNHVGGAVILNNGNGTLSFTNSTFNAFPGTVTTVDRTLTLGGSYSGSGFNEIQGTIQDNVANAAQTLLTVSGSKWKLSGTNSYTGATSVTGGTLLINGSTSTSVVTVGASGTLGGDGLVGGNTTVNGSLRPGNSPGVLAFGGNLTLGSTSSTTMEIGGITRDTQYDGVNVTGAMAYNGTLTIDLSTLFGGGSYTFDLFNLTNTPTGSFTSVSLTGSYTGILTNSSGVWTTTTNSGNETWTFTQSTGDLALNVIPEPCAALLGGIGLLMMLRRRR